MSVEIEDEEAPAVVGDKDKRGASKEAPESLEKEAKVEGHSPGEREVSPSSRGRELELYPACKASTKHYKRKLQERQEEKRERDSGSRGSRRPVSPEKRSRRASPGHGEEEESEGRAPCRGGSPGEHSLETEAQEEGRKGSEPKEFTRKKIEERRARKKQKQWHQKPK